MSRSPFTFRLVYHVVIVCLGALQFGYHLSELNAPEAYISCQARYRDMFHTSELVDCIPMNANQIGLVNSIFSIGGLISATVAGRAADKFGRRGLTMINCISYIIGPAIMSVSTNFYILMLGRFISGLGSGASLIVIPMYLNEISPAAMTGMIGAMCQEFVNIGILSAQVFGIFFSDFTKWRIIVSIGGILGLVNLLLIPLCVESPKWLTLRNRVHDARVALIKLRGLTHGEVAEADLIEIDDLIESWKDKPSLKAVDTLETSGSSSDSTYSETVEDDDYIQKITPKQVVSEIGKQQESLSAIISSEEGSTLQSSDSVADVPHDFHKVSYKEFLTTGRFRRPLIAIIGILTAQQFCGINTMIFYGVTILSALFPTAAVLVNVLISLLNCLVNLAIAPLVDRVGRRPLLLISIGGMSTSSFLLAFGILKNVMALSGVAATIFVAFFSVGLGPIPFLIIPELTEASSVGVAQSVGFTCNWVAVFLVGYLFPILNQLIGGYVFFILSGIAACYFVFTWKFVPETKGKMTFEAVWGKPLDSSA
ncbi:major facilitator superfamily domain-containing protein [Lipomyces tetrasporus]|uniref:Major facilitator superfamily domain-containing protein n=1 Tax=Lipomyces tetrasporus TaxID=54092 RepID=A0AAD7QRX8_9ASCO|nr:major facilitator superfamily domain-containing protein [Lipomyces tetrasporus]KAJ8100304.1 major facilitator superfamily domain-containing protein [Lipomyces tetrasporus]